MLEFFINGILLVLVFIGAWSVFLMFYRTINIIKIRIGFVFFTFVHFFISFVFAFFLDDLETINDPKDFYSVALESENWFATFGLGHDFMSFLIYPFVKIGVCIEVLFLLFALISYKAFVLLFDLISIEDTSFKMILLLGFFFFPTIHIWTGFLGKEALLLFALVSILYKIRNSNYSYSFVSLLLLVFLVRPHMFLVVSVALVLTWFFDKNISKIKFLILLSAILIGFSLFIVFFVTIDIGSMEAIKLYRINFINYVVANSGSSSIGFQNTNIFERIVYLMFMPLPFIFEIKNNTQWIAVLENIYIVFTFVYLACYIVINKIKFYLDNELRFVLISVVLSIVGFASFMFNLGQGNRMRIMFYPYLFYFLIRIVQKKRMVND